MGYWKCNSCGNRMKVEIGLVPEGFDFECVPHEFVVCDKCGIEVDVEYGYEELKEVAKYMED